MIDLRLDLRAFEQAARTMGAAIDQVPFALSQAMNEAASVTRNHEINIVWPAHVNVRNRNFLRAALRTEFASKRKLTVAIFDQLGRAHLKLHDVGGTKRARGKLAIPGQAVRRGSRGVVASQRPGALKNSFRQGNAIYQRVKSGKRQTVRRMYTLTAQARQPADVPFTREFVDVMRREMRMRFGQAMQRAMRTGR
jgi:hypothetical protein